MGRLFHLPPSAACLSASMRDLGYSLEAAIADLIDNSISANTSTVDIICDQSSEIPALVIHDNGHGMSETELINAMRHGTISPQQNRSQHDLGRFGLGLKTSSFSQCRSLTVVSRKDGVTSGAEWNLDQINADDDWNLTILDDADIDALPFIQKLNEHGTAVIWTNLDRLLESEEEDQRDAIVNEKLEVVHRHLALVFHRFLAGEVKGYKQLSITINGHPVTPFDPFCRKNPATQVLPEEIIRINETEVRFQPYILPHHSRLSTSEYDYYQSRSDFISNQGAYVYRNGRLMAWGDWFRMVPKGEATKLARVQIDFPNSLDEAWTIDIKKSRARPPQVVRERLRQIIDRITCRSVQVHRGRGERLFQESRVPLWERYADHNGIHFSLNEQHPLIAALEKKLASKEINILHILLDSISASLPIEMIYSDYSTNPHDIKKSSITDRETKDKILNLWQAIYGESLGNTDDFLNILRSIKIFEDNFDEIEKHIKEEFS
ncbi:ATP-binding protein [Oceanobacter sp. 4_MG-2023]|uniref:ATP-binding protein n=1 Tax=Oceanobacter sp. 4_MG-2023 TaxID=3062623 RepID=UPI00273513A2|nr:ATP-binding protein [Oceanobacter sp. 4_MG-2023]MDP2546898.1 ATP-binding protein [Oceanobacter sp. 4_MG-2023]